jgi:hypothetical protein
MSTSTLEVIEKISTSAKPRQEKRIIKSMKPGQMVRQGDIYLINITGKKEVKVFNTINVSFNNYITSAKPQGNQFQLVPGSTMGSRHMVDSSVKVKLNPTNTSSLVGPVIESESAFLVTHPEHAHFELPKGSYLVCYQLNALTRERVKD